MRSLIHVSSLATLAAVALMTVASSSASASSGVPEALGLLKERMQQYEGELLELAGIPSVSALPDRHEDVLRASRWLVNRTTRVGLENAKAMDTGTQPVVYADWLHAGADKPTVLFYGHYDVQPADPLELWDTPPFEPVVDRQAGLFRGRGVSDDKQGIITVIQALETVMDANDGKLPINVKLLLEGQEEIGSPDFEEFLSSNAEHFSCTTAINADGMQSGEDSPGIILGMRGMAALEVELRTLSRDLHSGTYGGSVQNPNHAMAELIAGLHSHDGAVAVEGFYEGVVPVSEEDKQDMATYPHDEAAELQDIGASGYHGEAGFSTLERRWLRPTLEVVGMWGGFTGDGLKTVLPAVSHAKISCRLVPGQAPADILSKVEAHLKSNAPTGSVVTTRALGKGSYPFVASRTSPVASVAAAILEEEMGGKAMFFKAGGSIPALAIIQRHLGVEPVSFGFTLDSDLLHSPNEHFRLSMFAKAHRAYVKLIMALGSSGSNFGHHQRDEL